MLGDGFQIVSCPQNTIDIGGVQCKPGKELPPDLKKFMESLKLHWAVSPQQKKSVGCLYKTFPWQFSEDDQQFFSKNFFKTYFSKTLLIITFWQIPPPPK